MVTDFQADKLSSWLGIDVDEDQVVMSHSPLKMFRDYHNKHVLVIGQGPVDDIARALGFTKVTTIQQLRTTTLRLKNVAIRSSFMTANFFHLKMKMYLKRMIQSNDRRKDPIKKFFRR